MASQSSSPPFSPSSIKGFTIVELLIVIVVIAILAAITVVAYEGMQDRARLATAQQELANILDSTMSIRGLTRRLARDGERYFKMPM